MRQISTKSQTHFTLVNGNSDDMRSLLWKKHYKLYNEKYRLGEGKKKHVLRANWFQKAVGRSCFFLNFFFTFFCKITRENHDFFLLASLEIFDSNFCSKNGWFYTFGSKKKKKNLANGEKVVSRTRKTGFSFFLALAHNELF